MHAALDLSCRVAAYPQDVGNFDCEWLTGFLLRPLGHQLIKLHQLLGLLGLLPFAFQRKWPLDI